jgi:hypothetical protein
MTLAEMDFRDQPGEKMEWPMRMGIISVIQLLLSIHFVFHNQLQGQCRRDKFKIDSVISRDKKYRLAF